MDTYRSIAYQRYGGNTDVDYAKFANAYSRRIAKKIKISQDWRCLDVACGYGNFLAYLRNLGVTQFTGVDSSREATKVAAEAFGQAHVVCGDIFQFLVETSNNYDLVSALDFIEHLTKEELVKFLFLLRKIQTPSGLLLLRTPNANGLFGMAARYNDITHEISFTPNAITDVLARSGYSVVNIWEDGAAPGSIVQTAHWLIWILVRSLIQFVNASEIGSWGDGVLTRNMWVLAESSRSE